MNTSHRIRLALGVLCTSAAILPAQDWPQFQADAAHSGSLPIRIRGDSLKQNWSVQVSTSRFNPITAQAGMIFASGPEKTLWALNASDGSTAWSKSYTTAYSVNPPSYADGRVFIQTGNHNSDTYLRCYDAKTGAIFYRAPHGAQWESYFNPTIYDGTVYINGGNYGGMYAFTATNGQQEWFHTLAQRDGWTPAVDALHAYTYISGLLSVVNRSTGALAWSLRDGGASGACPAPMLGGLDDLIVLQQQRLVRFDLVRKQIVFDLSDKFSGHPAVADEVIYAINDGELEARSQLDGHLLWSFSQTGAILSGNVVVTASHVLVSAPKKLFVIDLATHLPVFEAAVGGYLAVADNAVYVAGTDGYVTSIGFKQLPNPERLDPARVHYARIPARVTLHGSAFQQGTGTRVFIDGVEAKDVSVSQDTELTFTPPVLSARVADVRVENSLGSVVLERGMVFYPALEVVGEPELDSSLEFVIQCARRDHVRGLLGVPTTTPIAIPGIAGVLDASQPLVFAMAPYWFAEEFRFQLRVPNDPALHGVQVIAQGLVVPSAGLSPAAFTNSERIVIR